jgi:hypothetical protein
MIHFEILESPDLNVLTSFKFFKNEIYIGRRAEDLSVSDASLKDLHILLEVPEAELLIHPQKDVTHYLLNGKRSTSIRKLKVGDSVTFGACTLKIIAYEHTSFPSKKEILDSKLEELVKKASPRLAVIEAITKQMK